MVKLCKNFPHQMLINFHGFTTPLQKKHNLLLYVWTVYFNFLRFATSVCNNNKSGCFTTQSSGREQNKYYKTHTNIAHAHTCAWYMTVPRSFCKQALANRDSKLHSYQCCDVSKERTASTFRVTGFNLVTVNIEAAPSLKRAWGSVVVKALLY